MRFVDAPAETGRAAPLSRAEKQVAPESDLARLLADLAAGKKVSLLVAPAAQRHFGDYRQLFAELRGWGLQGFYKVLRYADIVVWAYQRQIETRRRQSLIASACPAVTLHVLRQKQVLQPCLMPVVSPVIAAALYLRKYKAVQESFAFLTPCVCKRQEIELYGRHKTGINYCVTIRELQQQLLASGASLHSLTPIDYSDAAEPFIGESLASFGGIGACLSRCMADFHYRQTSGAVNVYPLLDRVATMVNCDEVLDDLLELNHCCQGCDGGAGIGPPWPFSKPLSPECPEVIATLPNVWRKFDEWLDADVFSWTLDNSQRALTNERSLI